MVIGVAPEINADAHECLKLCNLILLIPVFSAYLSLKKYILPVAVGTSSPSTNQVCLNYDNRSLVFFNSAKSFNRVVEIGIVLFDASVLVLDIYHSVLAFELDGFNTC